MVEGTDWRRRTWSARKKVQGDNWNFPRAKERINKHADLREDPHRYGASLAMECTVVCNGCVSVCAGGGTAAIMQWRETEW